MTIDLTNEEKIGIINSHIKNLSFNSYNIQINIVEEQAKSNPDQNVIESYNSQVNQINAQITALNAQITHPHHVNHLIYSIPLNNTTNFCNFFYKFYDKNCISFDPMVHHKIAYHNIQMYHPFFQTQTSMIRTATNPLIFK